MSPPAITVGRAQAAGIHPAGAAADGLQVIIRPSGGGPVLWDDDLIAIDIVLPTGHPLLPVDVVEAYRWVGEAMASALIALGINGVRALPPEEARAWPTGPASGLCFGGVSPWEVVVDDRKIVGLAQVRRQAGGIIQVGVPMRLDHDRLARAVGAGPEAVADLVTRTTGVAALVPGVTRERVTDVLVAALL